MITVIIATENSENVLTPTLAALVPGAAAGRVREVIVADPGSTDGTAEVADIAGCDFFISAGPLAQRLRDAAARARSPWLMFLRAGVVLDPTWVEETGRFIQQAELLGLHSRAAVFRRSQQFNVGGSVLHELLAVLRTALTGPTPDQGILISKRLYDQVGHHREAADTEADLLGRLGRQRIAVLRTGVVIAHKI